MSRDVIILAFNLLGWLLVLLAWLGCIVGSRRTVWINPFVLAGLCWFWAIILDTIRT